MVYASERDRADVKVKRSTWSKMQRTAFSLVFLDDSGVNTNLTRRYGRAQGKERVKDSVPLNTPKTTTIVSSVRLNGTTVPKFFSGSMNGNIFLDYVQHELAPSLNPGDLVIMIIFAATKSKASKKRFNKPARKCSIFPHIVRISIQLK